MRCWFAGVALAIIIPVSAGSLGHTVETAERVGVVPASVLGSAERVSCPNALVSTEPPPLVTGPLRTFTDDEFQRVVDLTSSARIIADPPPPILGDAVADARIRTLAEARGYRRRHDVGGAGLAWVGGRQLDPATAAAWRSMVSDARSQGVSLTLHSAYRSIARQRQIFLGKLFGRGHGASSVRSGRADAAIESILRRSSIPGYSRHHTGTTVDILTPGFGTASFGFSAAFRWLSADNYANAKRHGFVPSYPPAAGVQGPDPEPWEFVHVGPAALVDSNRLAVIERFDVFADRIVVQGLPIASDDVFVLYDDSRILGEVTGRCSPGSAPGRFGFAASHDGVGDVCLVQRWTTGERLLACRP